MSNDDRPSILSEDPDISSWDGWNYLSKDQWDNLDKAGVLEMLCALIEHDGLRAFSIYVLSMSHPKFWEVAASSTKAYHPSYENSITKFNMPNGKEVELTGLMMHIWSTMVFAMETLRRYGYDEKLGKHTSFDRARMRDIVAFSVILHDWAKNGNPVEKEWGPYTHKRHGEMASVIIMDQLLPMFLDRFPEAPEHDEIREMVKESCDAISSHYGVWSSEGLHPRDDKLTEAACILQEADFHSSRRFLGHPNTDAMMLTLRSCSPLFWERDHESGKA